MIVVLRFMWLGLSSLCSIFFLPSGWRDGSLDDELPASASDFPEGEQESPDAAVDPLKEDACPECGASLTAEPSLSKSLRDPSAEECSLCALRLAEFSQQLEADFLADDDDADLKTVPFTGKRHRHLRQPTNDVADSHLEELD